MRRVKVLIKGKVHGVFFRAHIEQKAKSLRITGYVKNVPEGIEAVFEGSDEKVKDMLEFCAIGPKEAKVTCIEIQEEPYQGECDGFMGED
mgnify:CR=1 FL=1